MKMRMDHVKFHSVLFTYAVGLRALEKKRRYTEGENLDWIDWVSGIGSMIYGIDEFIAVPMLCWEIKLA